MLPKPAFYALIVNRSKNNIKLLTITSLLLLVTTSNIIVYMGDFNKMGCGFVRNKQQGRLLIIAALAVYPMIIVLYHTSLVIANVILYQLINLSGIVP